MGKKPKKAKRPDLKLIADFADPWDRQNPPVFAGREKELGIVAKNCRRAWDRFRDGKKTGGHIVVLRGAPGAGKTSLLDEINESGLGGIDPITIDLPRETLENTAEAVWGIGRQVFPQAIEKFVQKTVTTFRGNVGALGFGGGERSDATETTPPRLKFADLSSPKLRKRWERPVCLLIDEIQAVTEAHGKCLGELHLGEHGLPIVTVVAGLANSAERMQRAMSPRLSTGNLLTLAALAPDEVEFCVGKMFDLCDVEYDSGALRRIAGHVSRHSEGWPQHVGTETAALFGELVKTRGVLEPVDLRAVEKQALAYRRISYSTRQSNEMRQCASLVANILKAIPETGIPAELALRLIAEKGAEPGPEPRGLPDGMNPSKFLDHLKHQGIFQPDSSGLLTFPIPSLRRWLIDFPDAVKQKYEAEAAARNIFNTQTEPWAEKYRG